MDEMRRNTPEFYRKFPGREALGTFPERWRSRKPSPV
jgi:hypothetical protein